MANAFENKFRADTSRFISELLATSGFEVSEAFLDGILAVVDALCDYTEEGRHLFPQIVVTSDLKELLRAIPFPKRLVLEETALSAQGFKSALKKSAALATGGWSIFMEVIDGRIRYGLVSVESSMLSPSLEANLLLAPGDDDLGHFALIRSVGDRLVQFNCAKGQLLVDFSLRSAGFANDQALARLVAHLVSGVSDEFKPPAENFVRRIFDMALPFSHGNLIGVVNQNSKTSLEIEQEAYYLWEERGRALGHSEAHWAEASMPALDRLSVIAKGIFLRSPIDLVEVVRSASSPGGDAALRAYASLARNMLNNDGITIFDTEGRILGY